MNINLFKRKIVSKKGKKKTVLKHKYYIDREKIIMEYQEELEQKQKEEALVEGVVEQKLSYCERMMEVPMRNGLLFNKTSTFRQMWDYFVMVVATYNCIILPIEIAWEPALLKTPVFQFVSLITDLFFFIDILVNFRTVYSDEMDEVRDTKLIAKHYLKGRFTIDVLSTVPFDHILAPLFTESVAKKLKLLSILKMFRLLRLSHIITIMNVPRTTKI